MPQSTYSTNVRAFISYHHRDKRLVDAFCVRFREWFEPWGIALPDKRHAVIRELGERRMRDRISRMIHETNLTIVLIGPCTHSRRWIDWEIRASLSEHGGRTPNGLMAHYLRSESPRSVLPSRLAENAGHSTNANFKGHERYGQIFDYPHSYTFTYRAIKNTVEARTERARFIENRRLPMSENAVCQVHRRRH